MNGSHQRADPDLRWNGNLSIPAGVRDSGPRSDRPRRRVAGRLSPSACAKFHSIVPPARKCKDKRLQRVLLPSRGKTRQQNLNAGTSHPSWQPPATGAWQIKAP
jgi:hypothetical protein